MLTRRATQWLVLTAVAACLPARLVAETPTPTVSPSPTSIIESEDRTVTEQPPRSSNYFLVVADIFYDSDKVVGMFPTYLGAGPNSYIEYQFRGDEIVRKNLLGSFGGPTSKPLGEPFAFHSYSDWFGHIRGFERVRQNPSPLFFIIPLSASEHGVEPVVLDFNGTPPGGHGTGVGTGLVQYLSDSSHCPSVAVSVEIMPGMESLTPSITAEYLPGNSSHLSIGQETFYLPEGLFAVAAGWVVAWGFEEQPSVGVVYVPSHLPLGPLKITHRLDGYVDDFATVELADLKERRWSPLLGATFDKPGYPTPSEAYGIATLTAEEGDFIMEPAIREKLLGQCELFTNLKHASDRNGDKVLDIADYQKLMVEVGRVSSE